jgi:hypothetical protein
LQTNVVTPVIPDNSIHALDGNGTGEVLPTPLLKTIE